MTICRLIPLLVGLALVSGASAAAAPACDDPRPLRMAMIPKSNARQQAQAIQPLRHALEQALGRRVDIVLSTSYGSVVEGLLAGSVDLAELGPASYALLMARQPSVTPFAALSKQGATGASTIGTYRAVLITRRDSALETLQSLRRKSLSLTDPASTSGAILPRHVIKNLTGKTMETYFGRITFAGSHDRAIEVVRKGLVDAAFVSSARVDEAVRHGRVQPHELAIVWESSPIPMDPFVYRNRLCKPLVENIQRVFFSSAEKLRPMFDAMDGASFVPVSDADYQSIRELVSTRP